MNISSTDPHAHMPYNTLARTYIYNFIIFNVLHSNHRVLMTSDNQIRLQNRKDRVSISQNSCAIIQILLPICILICVNCLAECVSSNNNRNHHHSPHTNSTEHVTNIQPCWGHCVHITTNSKTI